jgi:hypothetical protein
MKIGTRLAKFLGLSVFGFYASAVVAANGVEFFNAQVDGPTVLYYSGYVKDSKGNVVDKVMITISAKNVGMNFPFRNDSPGHFRSPDIGKAIKGLGKTVDPAQIEVTVSKAGYKVVTAPKVPNKLGAVQLDTFVLDPVDGAAK